ncbi:hypothetical protein [Enterovirga rhinocerotis]|uniref:DUF3592 domain-containing protein n=1 Tax=Enterovirga rhinocerotis TaxID=1339210 RepID=A0A4R7BP65_9HYPH|nr:hypothetical protein [Enterovirga rhinocerotis]TDR87161.1 hypothetical protein EV668_4241 [Enterovirga rhinocerotis]
MGSIVNWVVGKLKWLLIIAAIGGPVSAFIGWQDVQRVNDVVAKGQEAEATIVSAVRKKGRRSGTSYAVDLAWKDDKGADRTAEEVRVSTALSNRLFRGDRIVVDTVRIKYLADSPGKAGVVLVDDIKEELALDRFMMIGGSIVGLIGLIGCGFIFGLFARLRSKPDESLAGQPRTPMGPPAA